MITKLLSHCCILLHFTCVLFYVEGGGGTKYLKISVQDLIFMKSNQAISRPTILLASYKIKVKTHTQSKT